MRGARQSCQYALGICLGVRLVEYRGCDRHRVALFAVLLVKAEMEMRDARWVSFLPLSARSPAAGPVQGPGAALKSRELVPEEPLSFLVDRRQPL